MDGKFSRGGVSVKVLAFSPCLTLFRTQPSSSRQQEQLGSCGMWADLMEYNGGCKRNGVQREVGVSLPLA